MQMGSVPEPRPIIRGERVFLRPSELGLERIGLFYHDGNERGRRTYEKAGFVHEGTLRRAHVAGGEHHDVHIMSILRAEWLQLPRRGPESD